MGADFFGRAVGLATLAAVLTAQGEWHAAIPEARCDHAGQVELRPAIAGLAVGGQLMLMPVQTGAGTEVDHWARLARKLGPRVSCDQNGAACPDDLLRCTLIP